MSSAAIFNPNETALIYALLADGSHYTDVVEILGESGVVFQSLTLGKTYDAIGKVHAEGKPIDAAMVWPKLESDERLTMMERCIGGLGQGHSQRATDYARNVRVDYQRRESSSRLEAMSKQAARDGLDFDEAAARIEVLRELGLSESAGIDIGTAFDEVIDQVGHTSATQGMPTGIGALDKVFGGLRDGELIIVAARPSVGKTALALNFAVQNSFRNSKNTFMFSFEMDRKQIARRIASIETGVDWQRLESDWGKSRQDETHKLSRAQEQAWKSPFTVWEDESRIGAICRTIRKQVRAKGHTLFLIDYLQLIKKTGKPSENWIEIGEMSRALKLLAKEVSCPVVALAQLGRDAEKESDGFRMMAHLRESGNIEQDADVVLILHKPKDAASDEFVTCTVAKNRNGRTGEVLLHFDKSKQRFNSVEKSREPQDEDISRAFGDDEEPF